MESIQSRPATNPQPSVRRLARFAQSIQSRPATNPQPGQGVAGGGGESIQSRPATNPQLCQVNGVGHQSLSIPEPVTLSLLAVGMLMACRRRR